MSDQISESDPSSSSIAPSIFLDYGADRHDCVNQGFEICERGMRFNSHWQFSLGTQLAVAFAYQDSKGETRRVTTEGIIVDCEQITCKCYVTTLLFLELPESLRAVVRSASPQLEASVANKGELRTIPFKASLN
jgi:hypothetical protein